MAKSRTEQKMRRIACSVWKDERLAAMIIKINQQTAKRLKSGRLT
ncbi:MAG: hypothetical protein WCG99_02260 [Candidatus Berkelbacteria bacterium]